MSATPKHRLFTHLLGIVFAVLASLLVATPAMADDSITPIERRVYVVLGDSSQESYISTWALSIFSSEILSGTKATSGAREKIMRFNSANAQSTISGSGVKEDPYNIDGSKGLASGVLKNMGFALNRYHNPERKDGYDDSIPYDTFDRNTGIIMTVKPLDDDVSHRYVNVSNLNASILDPCWGKGEYPEKDKDFYCEKNNIFGVDGCDVTFTEGVSISSKKPVLWGLDELMGTHAKCGEVNGEIKCGSVIVKDGGTLTLKTGSKTSTNQPTLTGRVTNEGSLTIEQGSITGTEGNDNLALVSKGTTTLGSGATVNGNIKVESGTLKVEGATITGDIIVGAGAKLEITSGKINGSITDQGGELEVSGGVTVTGNVSTTSGITTITSGTISGAASNSGNGTTVFNGTVSVSKGVNSTGGTVVVKGSGQVNASFENDGGTINIEDGAIKKTLTNKSGTVTFDGGAVKGEVTNSGGKIDISGNVTASKGIVSSGGSLNLISGTLAGGISTTGGETTLQNGTVTGNVANSALGKTNITGDASVSEGVSNTGGNVTLSSGTLTGNLTTTGGSTTLENGTVTGTVAVSSNGKTNVSGVVTVTGDVSNNGGTASISSAGTLTGDLATTSGTTTIGGTVAGAISNSGGSVTVSGTGAAAENGITTTGGSTTIFAGTISGDVSNTEPGTTQVSGGTFDQPVDPEFLTEAVKAMVVGGASEDDSTYTYAPKASGSSGHAFPIKGETEEGLLLLGMGFEADANAAKKAITEEWGELYPGTTTEAPSGGNVMWAFFYGDAGAYDVAFTNKSNTEVWSNESGHSITLKEPGFGVFAFSFDKDAKDKLKEDVYTTSITRSGEEKASVTGSVALSSIRYDLDGGELPGLPDKTYYQQGTVVDLKLDEEPTRKEHDFHGWDIEGAEKTSIENKKVTIPNEPKEIVVKPLWQHEAVLTLKADPDNSELMVGFSEELNVSLQNTMEKSEAGVTTVIFTLPKGIVLDGGTNAVKATCDGQSPQVAGTDSGFEVTLNNLDDDDMLKVSYPIKAEETAEAGKKSIQITATPSDGSSDAISQDLTVLAKPTLSIATTPADEAKVQQGSSVELTATIKNETVGSPTEDMTVTFTLPDEIELAGAVDPTASGGVSEKTPTIEKQTNGFDVKAEGIDHDTPLVVTYTVEAAENARLEEKPIAINATAKVGSEVSAEQPLQVTQKPDLAITVDPTENATVQQGSTVELVATVTNSVAGSTTGNTVVTFTLPAGLSLEEGLDAVSATGATGVLEKSTTENGFSVSVSGIPSGEPLVVRYGVKAANDAKLGPTSISLKAAPELGVGEDLMMPVTVTQMPAFVVADTTTPTFLQQGSTAQVETSVSNTVAGSATGRVTVRFELPRDAGITIDESSATPVQVVYGEQALEPEVDDKGFTVTLDELAHGTPLVVSYTVRAADTAPQVERAIAVTITSERAAGKTTAASKMTVVEKPGIQVALEPAEGASVKQGESVSFKATLTNPVAHSRTGKTLLTFALPPKVSLTGTVSAKDATNPTFEQVSGGFTVGLDELPPDKPVTISFDAHAANAASVGTQIIEVRATPQMGVETTSRTTLNITPSGALAIETRGATVEPGHAAELLATLTNDTVGSLPKDVTVTFSLPEGVSLEGEPASAVRATYGGNTLQATATASGFALHVDEMAYLEPLSVAYAVLAAEDTEPGEATVTVTAKPADGVTSTAEAALTIAAPDTAGAPTATEIAESVTAEDVLSEIGEAAQGAVSVEAPATEVAKDGKSATVTWTVHVPTENDGGGEPGGENAGTGTDAANAQEAGEAVVEGVLHHAQNAVSGAKSSLAMSMDDPSITLDDLAHAGQGELASFVRRCVDAALDPVGVEALAQAAGLGGKTVTVLVITDEGTENETLVTYTFSFVADAAGEPPAEGEDPGTEVEPAEDEVVVYRLYNRLDGSHLLTADINEYESLPVISNGGWVQEGSRYTLPATSQVPIHRLYNPTNGDHLYSADEVEVATLTSQTAWQDEGVKLYGAVGEGTVPIYRLWNPYQRALGGLGSHLWTESAKEYQALPGYAEGGWVQEGEVWRALRVTAL